MVSNGLTTQFYSLLLIITHDVLGLGVKPRPIGIKEV